MATADDPMDPANVKSGSRMNTLSVTHQDYRALWDRCRKAEQLVAHGLAAARAVREAKGE